MSSIRRIKVALVHVLNLLKYGSIPYMTVDAIQRDLHRCVARFEAPDTLIAWESQPTYTAGRRTQPQDIPDSHVPVITMDRGGSVTFHGPGQLIVYPIVKVKPPRDVVAFVRATELAIGRAMQHFGVRTQQVEGRSGAWILRDGEMDRKLAAIGIKFADDATMHGMAVNVATNIDDFMRIVPCGLEDAGVTSLAYEGVETTLAHVADTLLPELSRAYEQFLMPERIEPTLVFDDPDQALNHIKGAHTELPPKTGVAWKADSFNVSNAHTES